MKDAKDAVATVDRYRGPASLTACLGAIALTLVLGGCAGTTEKPPDYAEVEKAATQAGSADALGIEIEGIRLSAAGYMLDFRYRVLDPVKAAPLLDRKIQLYLLDEASGARLAVPSAPKVGSLRTSSRSKIIPGRNYYILFANPGRYLQAGSKVTLVAGDAEINHLIVN
ncbi:MAG: hypothetical protein K0M46_09780 [Thiobacillus sp.]|nr:hypothetical protein [Thiobacillus sp.]